VEHDESDSVMKLWEVEMGNFVPDTHFSTEIKGKSDEIFYHYVNEGEELNLRGAYFSTSKKDDKGAIDFFILDSGRRVIYSRRKRAEGLFNFNTTSPGEYMFVFSNLKVNLTQSIIFSYQIEQKHQEPHGYLANY